MEQALEGLKVLDFTWVIAGPTATKCLADHGATVIKVESRKRLCIYRSMAPYAAGVAGVNRSYAFNSYNTSKLGITLDLTNLRGIQVCKRLVAWADVVVENFTAGTMDKWGLGYEELKKVNPQIIMMSASLQGQKGPWASQPGFGIMMQASAGYTRLIGWPDRPPVQPSVAITDFVGAWYINVLILAALDYRERTGDGVYIDMSQLEAGVSALSPAVLEYTANRRRIEPQGNRSEDSSPHGAFRCVGDDCWCVISISQDSEWESFSRVIGCPWARDPRFSTLAGRRQNEDELEKLIEAWTIESTSGYLMSILQAAGVQSGTVATTRDLTEDPQLQHREHFRTVIHPEIGKYVNAATSFRLSKTPQQIGPAPCLGEHNYHVCREILGMSDDEYISLLEDSILN